LLAAALLPHAAHSTVRPNAAKRNVGLWTLRSRMAFSIVHRVPPMRSVVFILAARSFAVAQMLARP
jgi:hypothetical protein